MAGLYAGERPGVKMDAGDDDVGGDDAADCLRYLVAKKTRTIEVRKLRGL